MNALGIYFPNFHNLKTLNAFVPCMIEWTDTNNKENIVTEGEKKMKISLSLHSLMIPSLGQELIQVRNPNLACTSPSCAVCWLHAPHIYHPMTCQTQGHPGWQRLVRSRRVSGEGRLAHGFLCCAWRGTRLPPSLCSQASHWGCLSLWSTERGKGM